MSHTEELLQAIVAVQQGATGSTITFPKPPFKRYEDELLYQVLQELLENSGSDFDPTPLLEQLAAIGQQYDSLNQAYATLGQELSAVSQAYAAIQQELASVNQAYAALQQENQQQTITIAGLTATVEQLSQTVAQLPEPRERAIYYDSYEPSPADGVSHQNGDLWFKTNVDQPLFPFIVLHHLKINGQYEEVTRSYSTKRPNLPTYLPDPSGGQEGDSQLTVVNDFDVMVTDTYYWVLLHEYQNGYWLVKKQTLTFGTVFNIYGGIALI